MLGLTPQDPGEPKFFDISDDLWKYAATLNGAPSKNCEFSVGWRNAGTSVVAGGL